ncbi:MAG: DUF507 family protein [bacterium]|nr:DUF507 family protein [bacterium]
MRLSPAKIEYLADKMIKIMREREDISFLIEEDELARIIGWEITEELKIEDEIEDEVDKVLEQYERQIMNQDMDQTMLRRKLKTEIARKRGYTI